MKTIFKKPGQLFRFYHFQVDNERILFSPQTINDKNFAILRNILLRFSNVKNFVFEGAKVKGNLFELAKLFPKVQRFQFTSNSKLVYNKEFDKFAMVIGLQFKYCTIHIITYPRDDRFYITELFLKYFKNIEELSFNVTNKQQVKVVFEYLN